MSDDGTALPPGAAGKVLAADLRNTVAHVAAGDRLPEADRGRLETAALKDADPDTVARLAKERQANLLRIWASGRRRLNPDELQELAPILPSDALARQPRPPDHQPKVSDYAKIYGVAERTIKHWSQIGRSAKPPDLPPFDEPAKMKDWYARNKKNRVPDRLVQLSAQVARLEAGQPLHFPAKAAALAEAEPATGHVSGSSPRAPAAAAPAGIPATVPRAAARGYLATLERLREAESAAGERYTRLILEVGKESEAEQARRAWESLTKQMRAYEKDAREVLEASGQLWPAAEVKAVIFELHAPLRDSIESLYDRLESKLDTLPRAERKKAFRAEVARLFAGLLANRFTAPPEPAQAAA